MENRVYGRITPIAVREGRLSIHARAVTKLRKFETDRSLQLA
jgi:hypothetical protein